MLERLRRDWSGPVLRLLAPLSAFIVEGWPALVFALLVQEVGLWAARKLADPCQRRFATRLFAAAFGLRIAVALPTHYVAKLGNGNGALFADDYTNDLVGEWLARIARGDGSIAIFPGHQHLLDGLYAYLLMGIYLMFGYAPLLPKLLNGGLAALSAVLVFDMSQRTFRRPAAVLAGFGAAVLPTMLLWSVATLKESLVLLVALASLRGLQFITTASRHERRFVDVLVVLVGLDVLLLDLRPPTAFIILLLLAIVFAARSRLRVGRQQLAVAALALVVIGAGVWIARLRTSDRPITAIAEDVMLQIRHRRAQESSTARSQLRPEADVLTVTGGELPAAEAGSDASPFTVIDDVLDPVGYALLAPAPWQARGLSELAVSTEMLVWYVLMAGSLFAWRGSPRQRLFVTCLAVYGVANWLVLAASEGNLGNLLRHRLLLDPVLLILGTAGLEWLWVRAGRPFSARVPPRLIGSRPISYP